MKDVKDVFKKSVILNICFSFCSYIEAPQFRHSSSKIHFKMKKRERKRTGRKGERILVEEEGGKKESP